MSDYTQPATLSIVKRDASTSGRLLILIAILGFILTCPVFSDDDPRVIALDVVTSNAATGDGGNAWGGHQCRIVRTSDGVFTAYTVSGKNDMSREWRLAWRQDDKWKVVAAGLAGREPVNLLASPDGTLQVIGWPEGKAVRWTGKPSGGKITMTESPVPGLSEGHWPYGSAGIDKTGLLCVLSSEGEKPGAFRWAMLDPQSNEWTTGIVPQDYRHCYTYVIPDAKGSLALVSTRDVRWKMLGYTKPKDQFEYVFNEFSGWRSGNPASDPLRKIFSLEEKPTDRDPVAMCSAQDVWLDSKDRLHVFYRRAGKGTGWGEEGRYAVFSPGGKMLSDEKTPWSAGLMCRIFQDDRGRFYFLGSDKVIYNGGTEGVSFKNKTKLKLGRELVEEAGYGISAPRTGTALGNILDVVFPSAGGAKWIYARILLYGGDAQPVRAKP
ncbi:MAG: hypothetical protein K8R87_09525 [Verrucomicrobia bacterium]|nr:hypothetical protein [Verrucomicrobiota bacterium]